ncbi:MAG: leucine-rich repeat domain-containing protein [Faecalibacterium sp.]|nr:leucine-rich repeat domain-containing protein [Ruminococcus sp.]MCM1391965.1 leucine-rich repeat domain-containing protein [Ruminococcus sp.]MCM1485076.1 leucine-rich repeat domain-containing protein [Faecalibacterium sp.]
MKKTSKKILSCVLAVVMLVCAMPMTGIELTASAASTGKWGDNVYWTLDDGILTFSGEGPMRDGRSVGFADDFSPFRGDNNIKSVIIGDGITRIGSRTFSSCSNLSSVEIPDSVTSIGEWAFSGCKSLTSISIPDSVVTIEAYGFNECTGLKHAILPSRIKSISSDMFKDCTSLESVFIPASVKSVIWFAFDGCSSLKDVYYPGSEEQWNQIKIDYPVYNQPLMNADKHFNCNFIINGIFNAYTTFTNINITHGTNTFVDNVTIDNEQYKIKAGLLSKEQAAAIIGRPVIAVIEKSEIIDIKVVDNLKVDVEPSLDLDNIIYEDGKYKDGKDEAVKGCVKVSAKAHLSKQINAIGSLVDFIKRNNAFDCEIESVTLTSSSDQLKFKDSSKWIFSTNKSITIKPKNAVLKIGEWFSVADFTMEMSDKHKMTEKTEDINIFCTVKYKLNGQSLESSTMGTIQLINNDYMEESTKDVNKAVKELNKLTNTVTLDTSSFWNEQLTPEQRNAIGDSLLYMVALSASDKSVFEKSLDKKIIDAVFSIDTNLLGVKSGSVSVTVEVKTKNYGKLIVMFTCDYQNYGLAGNSYAFNGDISYDIIGGNMANKVPKKSGSCGALYGANVKAFADTITDIAINEIKSSYNTAWGNDVNKAVDIIFGETMNKILKQSKYNSVSGLVWKSIITPATGVEIKCPVDVYVYNSNDELVAYVENDVAVSNDENVVASAKGHEKSFILFDDTYRLEYIATCKGQMTVEVNEYGTSVDLLSTQTVTEVPLELGETYIQNVDTNVLNEHDYTLTSSKGNTFKLEETYDGFHTHEVRSDWKDVPATCTENGYKYAFCSICNDWFKEDTDSALGHTYATTTTQPECTKEGEKVYTCSVCGDTYTEPIPATGHTDNNNDGKCDVCDSDIGTSDPSDTCDHICHKGGFVGFIYKIVRLFWKLFGINKTCSCGVAHY